uniref:KIAA1549-like b n=1 Tax=Neogobius melanostomus TaxID=47308 RepID=A0A8C6SHR9_9GOBI
MLSGVAVLQFVGAADDPRSCRFSQTMEQRLEKVFFEAQAKVLSIHNRLSVQMLSVSQAASSPAVSLVYTVKNGTVFLNGTTASNLLGQLSAELVGYFLFYPPLIIAERKLQFFALSLHQAQDLAPCL